MFIGSVVLRVMEFGLKQVLLLYINGVCCTSNAPGLLASKGGRRGGERDKGGRGEKEAHYKHTHHAMHKQEMIRSRGRRRERTRLFALKAS